MSIPKAIHYCWFGRNPKPKLARKCIRSWKKHCPDYSIIEWNEDNFDIAACPLYVRQAYEAKKWAFVTDYVRLKVIYDHGGIYMDTDVELKKGLDSLLCYEAFFGFEDGAHIATGLGFGAVKGLTILEEMMDDYNEIPFFREDGSFDMEACPTRNTKVFLRHGLIQDDSYQILEKHILILPSIYLCPIRYMDGHYTHSSKTISVHRFSASWYSEEQRDKNAESRKYHRRIKRRNMIDYIVHTPNRVLKRVLGEKRYQTLKQSMKRGRE